MKMMSEKLLAGVVTVLTLAGTMPTSAARADVSANVGASNMYYWRGLDLGQGEAAVWGDLKASADSGLYGGAWTSSGDVVHGTEYDLYIGYGAMFGDFGVDISYWSYLYPEIEVGPNDLAEIVLALSYGPVTFTYYDNQEGNDLNYKYMTLATTFDKFTVKYGVHSEDKSEVLPGVMDSFYDGYSHLDLSYAFNSNLSFTLGQVVDNVEVMGVEEYPEDTKVVVNYTFPLE